MICFLGDSHAAMHLKRAAMKRNLSVCSSPENADVVFVSEDTPTRDDGERDLRPIRELVAQAALTQSQIVLTSQVPPGFTRSLGITNAIHQAETLRIRDAEWRAMNPDYIAVGGVVGPCKAYKAYLDAFGCPIRFMSWEEAEMTKIAVNMMLAAQVDYTNRMAAACDKVGANWKIVADAIGHDKRIGHHAYLTPGRWQDSKHLLRDHYTLENLK